MSLGDLQDSWLEGWEPLFELAARVKDWENKTQIVSYQSYMILQLQRGIRSQLQIKTFLDLELDLYVLQFKW